MRPVDPFPGLLHAFFYERLVEQRNVSPHTVKSYRDTWRLFLRFAAVRHKRAVAALTLADLSASDVTAFLQHSEQERKVSIGTRNCRLAALRSFFCFVAEREPAAVAQCADVLHDEEVAHARTAVSRIERDRGDPRSTGSRVRRGPARPRAAVIPLQHRCAHTGGT